MGDSFLRYTLRQLVRDFPDDDTCLEFIFRKQDPTCLRCGGHTFYKVQGRLAYVCYCGHQIHPLKGTIFEGSRTSLTDWFYVIFLFSVSRNGVAATEIQRHIGVTYKTAWRMGHRVRSLMKRDDQLLEGTVEVDETYIGGRHRRKYGYSKKAPVFGAVEKNGKIHAVHVKSTGARVLLPEIYKIVKPGTHVHTDEYFAYKKLSRYGYTHSFITHSKYQWANGDVHTNTIEGFWGQLKRSLRGTHHSVSKKWLQYYVDEFVFRYNYRHLDMFNVIIERAHLRKERVA